MALPGRRTESKDKDGASSGDSDDFVMECGICYSLGTETGLGTSASTFQGVGARSGPSVAVGGNKRLREEEEDTGMTDPDPVVGVGVGVEKSGYGPGSGSGPRVGPFFGEGGLDLIGVGGMPDHVCSNENCGKMYHRRCLVEWLQAVPSSRSSFGTIFGSCPYCAEMVSVENIL